VREPRRRSEPWGLFAVAAKLVVAGNGLRLLHVTLTYPLLVERRSTVSLALLSAVEDDGCSCSCPCFRCIQPLSTHMVLRRTLLCTHRLPCSSCLYISQCVCCSGDTCMWSGVQRMSIAPPPSRQKPILQGIIPCRSARYVHLRPTEGLHRCPSRFPRQVPLPTITSLFYF
jgi:hypothetical protein